MASFVLSFSPRDVLDQIWDSVESVSEGFPTYSCHSCMRDFPLTCSVILPSIIIIILTASKLCSENDLKIWTEEIFQNVDRHSCMRHSTDLFYKSTQDHWNISIKWFQSYAPEMH